MGLGWDGEMISSRGIPNYHENFVTIKKNMLFEKVVNFLLFLRKFPKLCHQRGPLFDFFENIRINLNRKFYFEYQNSEFLV